MSHRSTPVILVTGAGRGLGRGIASRLARDGYSVAINYARNADAAAETVEECIAARTNAHQQFSSIQADISVTRQRERLVERVLTDFGCIDGLINNAGIAPRVRADITNATEESFEEVIRTNLQGPYFLTQRVVSYWLAQRPRPLIPSGFKIIFVTSISARTASVNRGDYCISKAGLSMAAKLWAVRLAAEGIQVVELRPGIMATDMTSAVKGKYNRLISEGLVPEGRWGKPEDVAAAASAVIRGDLPFATGSIIDVDGGFHLSRL
jgi:NAD(P)-dependent dehydrogenase (short-subunit alcohol dehydrogenase family)